MKEKPPENDGYSAQMRGSFFVQLYENKNCLSTIIARAIAKDVELFYYIDVRVCAYVRARARRVENILFLHTEDLK